jgi:ribosomal protein S18 acetylase RimI-like enzyme
MKGINILDAALGDERIIHELAWATWWTAYGNIVSAGQIRYMLEVLYNEETLRRLINNGEQRFIVLSEDGRPCGFAAYSARPEDPSIYKLHKLYVLPDCQGKGFGHQMLQEVIARLETDQVKALELNVNRRNPARKFYESNGFVVVRDEDIAIGPYWMNDYVMRLTLETTT